MLGEYRGEAVVLKFVLLTHERRAGQRPSMKAARHVAAAPCRRASENICAARVDRSGDLPWRGTRGMLASARRPTARARRPALSDRSPFERPCGGRY